jgi:hypothetical protein
VVVCPTTFTIHIFQVHLFTDCTHAFVMEQQSLEGQGLLFNKASRSHSDTAHSVGLLAMDRPVAETSTCQQRTLTRDRHSCPRRVWTSNPNKLAVVHPRIPPGRHRIICRYGRPMFQAVIFVSISERGFRFDPGPVVRGFWWKVWRWDRIFSEYFSFLPPIFSSQSRIFIVYMLILPCG